MRFVQRGSIGLAAILMLAGCGDDTTGPAPVFGPPGTVSFVTGPNTVRLSWGPSTYEGASDFGGYNVYVDTAPIAGNDDPVFLAARLVNTSPVAGTSYTVSSTAGGGSLQQGTRYYFHVRTRGSSTDLSIASNEVDTAPRPEGNNGSDPSQYMYDFDDLTETKSAYGWNVVTGQGAAYSASAANANFVELVMVEEPNSPDDGSLFLSPMLADFTSGWTPRHRTLIKDLGVGDAAWQTPIAPDPLTMVESVKVLADHTYAIRTYDDHWGKLRVTELSKNVAVSVPGGGTVQLNYVRFTFALQLIEGYGRFKPVP